MTSGSSGEVLFNVPSPLGYDVLLRRGTWERHEAKREDLRGQLANVELTVTTPEVVIESADGAHHYYRLGHGTGRLTNCYLHVLVPPSDGQRVVATAWFTPELEEGAPIWFRKP